MASGLTTDDINRRLSAIIRNADKLIQFLGVFPSDQLPFDAFLSSVSSPQSNSYRSICCVANIDPASQPGTHWVAFYLDCKSLPLKLEFFDSYAQSPTSSYHFPFLSNYSRNLPFLIETSSTPLQSFSTSVCGHYCILYLYLRARFSLHYYYAHTQPLSALQTITRKLISLGHTALSRDRSVKALVDSLSKTITHPISKFQISSLHSTSALPSSLNLSTSSSSTCQICIPFAH